MIPTIPVALAMAPATAAIATTGLEPMLWFTVGLMAATVALILRDVLAQSGTPRQLSIEDVAPRVRLHVVPKPPTSALDAA
jgi:hypothetical protein